MTEPAWQRCACLLVPVAALLVAAAVRRPDRRTRGAALFAFVAAAVGIAALDTVAPALDWWRFAPGPAQFQGAPVDAWLGWAVLWGPLPLLLGTPIAPTVVALGFIDLATMGRLAPLLRLGPHWLVGEAVGLAAIAAPAVLVGRWTAADRRLTGRVSLQLATVAGLVLWLAPSMAMAGGVGSWRHVTALPRWELSLLIQLGVLVAVPGVLAVREFAERGHGTPYPWDPPQRLVTSGPYAYVANPMQLSAVTLMLLTALATWSWSVAAAALFGVGFSATVATPHEHDDLTRRHGAAWSGYRSRVRHWWPRWRPDPAPARVYLARGCEVCSSTALALDRLDPIGVRLFPAEGHARSLRRARYEGPDGYHADGVAAVARTLEHVNLGWAMLGWCLRLPGLDRLVQSIVDSIGGGPRDIDRRSDGRYAGEAARRRPADHP